MKLTDRHPSLRYAWVYTLLGLGLGLAISAIVFISVILAGVPLNKLDRLGLLTIAILVLSSSVGMMAGLLKYTRILESEVKPSSGPDRKRETPKTLTRQPRNESDNVLTLIKQAAMAMTYVYLEENTTPSRDYMTSNYDCTQPAWNSAYTILNVMGFVSGRTYTMESIKEVRGMLSRITLQDNKLMIPKSENGFVFLDFSPSPEYGNSYVSVPETETNYN